MEGKPDISKAQALSINSVRLICERVATAAQSDDGFTSGVIYAKATAAEEALFDLLNALSSFSDSEGAAWAIEGYRRAEMRKAFDVS